MTARTLFSQTANAISGVVVARRYKEFTTGGSLVDDLSRIKVTP